MALVEKDYKVHYKGGTESPNLDKLKARKQIASDIEDFERSGGKIQKLDSNVFGYEPAKKQTDEQRRATLTRMV